MSIQDESFPVDAFLDELDFSPLATAGQRFQFPHYQREQQLQQSLREQQLASSEQPATTTTTSTSASASPTQTANTNTSSEQNLSSESNNGRPMSGMSAKTSASDPDDNGSKKSDFTNDYRAQQKAASYQDIHSEYTKRRYKHVASKVGQYIANMKAEEQKRRDAKFARHRSMPETLSSGSEVLLTAGAQQRSTLRYSANELNRNNDLNVSHSSDVDADVESATNTTATTSASAATTHTNNSSDDASTGDFIDKQSYALLINEKERIQSYSEYLQTKLDEKISENMRLKRNVDYMRIELTSCQDKLKLKEKANSLARLPLLYCQAQSTKGTQTEQQTRSPRDIYITPDTPDDNNNTMYDASTGKASKPSKSGTNNMQPLSLNFSNIVEQHSSNGSGGNGVLRQRTNSNPTTQHSKINNNNQACAQHPIQSNMQNNNSRSSSDSAIDIESVELSNSPRHKLNCARVAAHSTQSLRRNEELVFYDKRSVRYATLQALNVGNNTVNFEEPHGDDTAQTTSDSVDANCHKPKKRRLLRKRWLRFLAPCTRCSDQRALDNNSALQHTYTQIPLLEKSNENHCRNVR